MKDIDFLFLHIKNKRIDKIVEIINKDPANTYELYINKSTFNLEEWKEIKEKLESEPLRSLDLLEK